MLLGLVIVRKQSLRAVFDDVFLHWASFDELAGEMNSFSNKLLDSDYFRILHLRWTLLTPLTLPLVN